MLDGQKAITTVLLDGPGGIGKSWLASAVADELRRRGTAVRTIGATEAALRIPFGVVATLLGLPGGPEAAAGLADAALARVEELTVAGPLLLVVDDAQYCDADSLAALWRMSTAGRDLPVRLLITRRRLREREVLSVLGAQPQVAVRSLEPLSAADIDRLAAEFAGAEPGPRLRSLLARTDGSPLHVAAVSGR